MPLVPIGTVDPPLKRLRKILIKSASVLLAALLGLGLLTVLTVAGLRWIDPPTSAFMVRKSCQAWVQGRKDYRVHYRWVDLDRIAPYAGMAVVAAEDQKFPSHWGFDFESIRKALHENPTRVRPRGASTITQQVAKNLFLWPGRSLVRKGLEAYLTLLIEGLWPKRRVLEVYLNIAEFGPGIFGIQSASDWYFNRPPSRLHPEQAALLAAVLPNPNRYSVSNPSPYVEERVEEILDQMRLLGGPDYLRDLH